MVVTPRDLALVLGLLLVVLAAGIAAFHQRKRIAGILGPSEWVVLGKILAILVMLWLLMAFDIATEFPAERFIYGRF